MSKRILVVEDQEDNRRIMRVDLLTSAGFELLRRRPAEGVRLAETGRRSHPHGLHGPCSTAMRRRGVSRPEPSCVRSIIVVTSYALSGDDVKARAAGADGYVAKRLARASCSGQIRQFLP